MAYFVPRHNGALTANPPAGDAHITTNASDWLWTVFALMLISFLIVLSWTFSSRQHNRILHYIPLIVLAVAFVAYFSMASNLGWTLIRSEFDGHPTRQVWYVRYIQWFINAPLLLLALLAFTRLSTVHILTIMFFSWFLVVNGLIGALVSSSYKWGYFVFGLFGLFFIWGSLARIAFTRGSFAHENFRGGFLAGAAFLSFIWMLYPICWGLSEGSNTISPSSEMVFYGVLDLMSGPVFLFSYMALVTGFDTATLRTTAFGSTTRGEEENGPVVRKAGPGPGEPAAAQPEAATAQR